MLAMVIEFKRKGTNVLAGACIVLACLCFGYSKSSDWQIVGRLTHQQVGSGISVAALILWPRASVFSSC